MSVYPDGVEVVTTAVLSDDLKYRYRLIRRWGNGSLMPWIMLNPSTADHRDDDQTIRRCVSYAVRCGYSGIAVWNLYALRSTDPKALWVAEDPVGPENDRRLRNLLAWAEAAEQSVFVGWGANARHDRVGWLLAQTGAWNLKALGVTKRGAPVHPSRQSKTATFQPWPGSERHL